MSPNDAISIDDGSGTVVTSAKFADVRLLAPAEPSKIICAGLNYKSHLGQQQVAKYVGLFSKFPTSA